jgi:CARDB protein
MQRPGRFLSVILSMVALASVLPVAPAIAQTQPSAFEYVVKVVCGIRDRQSRVVFATSINIHNPGPGDARFFKKLALTFPPGKQQPGEIRRLGEDALKDDQALQTDCADIAARAFGGTFPTPYVEGFVVIQSPTSLDVTAVYTASGKDNTSIDVEQVRERQRVTTPPVLADLLPVRDASGTYCVGNNQDLLVTIKNQGAAGAGPSTTTVSFGAYGTQSQPTPALGPGDSVTLTFTIPPFPPTNCFDPNCEFIITADSAFVVPESDEANNIANGVCFG